VKVSSAPANLSVGDLTPLTTGMASTSRHTGARGGGRGGAAAARWAMGGRSPGGWGAWGAVPTPQGRRRTPTKHPSHFPPRLPFPLTRPCPSRGCQASSCSPLPLPTPPALPKPLTICVDVEHLPCRLNSLLLAGVCGVPLLPQKLGRTQEGARAQLPPHHVGPLVHLRRSRSQAHERQRGCGSAQP
jgi:hypothetical protein